MRTSIRQHTLESYVIDVWWRGGEENFEPIVFSSKEMKEDALYRRETSARVGGAT
jgi:hypothetical protein